jgi:hypothetical protein
LLDNTDVFDGNSVQLLVELLVLKSTGYNGYPEILLGKESPSEKYWKVELTPGLMAKYPSYIN